jgi:hypothetical protein
LLNVRANNGEVSTNDLKIKSLEIAKELNIENFKGSNGYIDKWKKRFNVKFKIFSGEGGSVDECVVNEWFSRLGGSLKQYDYRFIYNLD